MRVQGTSWVGEASAAQGVGPRGRCSSVEWISALAVSLAVLAAFWGPGTVVLWPLRIRGIELLATAPLVTVGLTAAGAIIADWAHVPWRAPTALAVTALAGLTAIALVRVSNRGSRPDALPRADVSPRIRRACGSAIGFGIVAQLLPLALGMGRPVRLLTAFDAVTHFSALAQMRASGSASSLTFFKIDTLSTRSFAAYPNGWHSVVALLSAWPDASTVFNVAVFVPVAFAWTLGLTRLTQVVFPSRPRVWAWAPALSAAGLGLPAYLALRPEGMVPNAFGTALVPAFVALVASVRRLPVPIRLALVATCVVGIGLTHPNALISSVVVLLPWAVPRAIGLIRRAAHRSRERLAVLGGAAVCVALAVGLIIGPTAAVVTFPVEGPLPWWQALVAVLSGNLTGMGLAMGFMVVATAAIGGVLAWRLPRARWLVVANVLMVTLYLLSTSSIPILRGVDRLWYGEPRRFAPVVAAVLIPLAALALDAAPRWLLVTRRVQTNAPPARTALGLGLFIVIVSTAGGAVGIEQLARDTFVAPGKPGPVIAGDAELAMMGRLRFELDRTGAVLGSPFSGTASLFGLYNQQVVMPISMIADGPDFVYLREHMADLGVDPGLCAPLHRLNVRYLYIDSAPSDGRAGDVDLTSAPEHGIRLVDSGGTASVYEVTACP